MARRHKKRSRKYLGSRRWGGGNIKSRRGKGSRGGKGYAGSHKHKWSYIIRYEPEHFGVGGFHQPRRVRLPVINLRDIAELAAKGALEEKEGKLSFEFQGKVLGSGSLSRPIRVRARAFSKSAEEKIVGAGGEAIRI
ncbi:MAG: uL15m family ribosomal protein [Candidatus Micrarchaeia archaeon]